MLEAAKAALCAGYYNCVMRKRFLGWSDFVVERLLPLAFPRLVIQLRVEVLTVWRNVTFPPDSELNTKKK
jgi:hypothetical protein